MNKIILGIAASAAICLTPSFMQGETLTLLTTNDTHSQIDPLSDTDLGGVVRRKALVDSVRRVRDNVLLIDAGDVVQGTLFFTLYKGEVEELAINELGYDMRILGNHEFDNGMQALADQLAGANAELLCSNYNFRGTPLEGVFKPYALREVGGKLLAFMPINIKPDGLISARNFTGAKYIDAVEAANGLAWYLKNIVGADAIVAITHIGYDDDVELAKQSRDIDVVIGGHSHTVVNPASGSRAFRVKNADGREVLVSQTGGQGTFVGEINIDLDSIGAEEYVPAYQLLPVDSRYDANLDADFIAMLAPYRDEVVALNTNILGKSAKKLSRKQPALLNFMADFVYDRGKQMAGKVDLSITNRGGLRNDMPAGDVSKGNIISIMPFNNRVTVIEVTGDSLLAAFSAMVPFGGQGVSQNVEATFDPDSRQLVDVRISGKPIDPSKTYRLATIDYLADGGDYMRSLIDHKQVAISDNVFYDDLADFLTRGPYKGKVINPTDKMRMHPVQK